MIQGSPILISMLLFFKPYNLLIFSRQDLNGLVVGGEDGIIRIYRLSPEIDTKSPEVLILKHSY